MFIRLGMDIDSVFMIEPQRGAGSGGPKRKGNLLWLGLAFVIIVVIAYLAIGAVANALSIVGINGPTTIMLTNSTTVFLLNNNEYAMRIVSAAPSQYAYVAITKLPVFLNPTLNVYLVLNNATDINTEGSVSNLQLTPSKIEKGQVALALTPIPQGLGVPPSYSRISVGQSALAPIGSTGGAVTVTTTATTTVSSGSTTSTTVTSTTTVSSSSGGLAAAQAVLKLSAYYPLMLNYTTLYQNSANCNSQTYNSSYVAKFGKAPSGVDTYANLSAIVPYEMNLTITNSSSTAYVATYKTLSHTSAFTGPAAVITIDTSSRSITSTTLEGAYLGLNYSILESGYLTANHAGNACGIYIASA